MSEPIMTSALPESESNEYLQYRALSILAVMTGILSFMSLPALFFAKLLVLPAIGILIGLVAVFRLRSRQHEYLGYGTAVTGLNLCLFLLVLGSGRAVFEYMTEVPDGYERISFSQLQPDKKQQSPLPIPVSAIELDGKQIFITGYVHPGVERKKGLKHFVLVPDMKTCCFGGQPELTDMIEVTLKDPNRIDYSFARRKLAGVLRVSPHKKPISGLDGVYYQLEADYVR